MTVLGAVLAGGASRRFGSDKAMARYQGRSLIDHVIASLAAQTGEVIVCGRPWHGETIADMPRSGLGPLGGLNAALHFARARGIARILTAPCDVVDLPHDLLARGGTPPWHLEALPVIGAWPATLAAELDAHLAATDDRSMRAWTARIGSRPVALARPLANINTPDELGVLTSP